MRVDIRSNIVKAVLPVVLLAATLTSCCAEKRVAAWTPKPIVQWDQVSTQPVQPVFDGYRIVPAQPTEGIFPASMAVTRVAIRVADGETGSAEPCLLADPRNEFLQWNSALDDQMAVSEVFPIKERDLGGGEAHPENILDAFRALHARLGLAYAVNELSCNETEMFGVLYDTVAAQPLASLHAISVSRPPTEDDGGGKSGDLWVTDSRALVRAKFERLVRTCIRQLILQDQPPPIESPTGWTPAAPARPVEWPPRQLHTGGSARH